MTDEKKSPSCGCTSPTRPNEKAPAPRCACGEACRCGDRCACTGCSGRKG